MHSDFWLFDHINAWAGRFTWLDEFGRLLAVYGLLIALLVIVATAWWPRADGRLQRRYLGALLTTAVLCAVLFGLEALLTQHVLHHELRARPANARWVTALITPQTRWNFPAWSIVAIFATVLPTYWVARRTSYALALFGMASALALVFVGANFPLDGLVGMLVGLVIGHTATAVSGIITSRSTLPVWTGVLLAWMTIGVLGATMAAIMQPASTIADSNTVPTKAENIHVSPPKSALQAIRMAVQPADVALDAATNGTMVAGHLRVLVPPATAPKRIVELARHGVNAAFHAWPELSVLTISIAEGSFDGKAGKLGTVYTATVDRHDWPNDGFAAQQALPGKKYYSARFYLRRGGESRKRADSPDRR